jgi:predicted ATPase
MKLLRITLEGQYKGLMDQTFDFSQAEGNTIAFVGLNGSGKSQLLELIAESFAYLERYCRPDFRCRKNLGCSVELEYLIYPRVHPEDQSRRRIRIEVNGKVVNWELYDNGSWIENDLEDIDLPLNVIGYSSGLNENLQRSFMKNSLSFFEVMEVRSRRRRQLDEDLDELGVVNVNKRFLQRYPGIFTAPEGEALEQDGYLSLRERDTKAPMMKYLDYDCNALLIACISFIDTTELDKLFSEIRYRYPIRFVLEYDLTKTALEEDTVRDIQQLIRLASSLEGLSSKASDEEYDLYELDFLKGRITFNLKERSVRSGLFDQYYGMPIRLFERLYKIQLLGVKAWQPSVKKSLKDDGFFGNVKKPLRTKLPLFISELSLEDEEGNAVDFDDLSDGEAQLMQTIAGVRTFRDENTLFIYDEPETHLNPSWRTHFHQRLTQASKTGKDNHISPRAQIVLSTHSPFLISSLNKKNVFSFNRQEDGQVLMEPSTVQTYGAAFEVLIKQFFGLRSLISQTAVEEIKQHIKELPPEEAVTWLKENMGDSMERSYLIRRLSS